MFFIFLAISARKADRLQTAANERANSRGARGTANRCEEKAKNLTADERRYTQMASQMRTQAMMLSKSIGLDLRLSGVVLFYSCPFVVNLWTLGSGFESGQISATAVAANTMRMSRPPSLRFGAPLISELTCL
jgi:hypothetical protein